MCDKVLIFNQILIDRSVNNSNRHSEDAHINLTKSTCVWSFAFAFAFDFDFDFDLC